MKKPREARLEALETFSGEKVGVLIRILESKDLGPVSTILSGATQERSLAELKYHILIPNAYRREIRREFIKRCVGKQRYEILLVIDPIGEGLADLISEAVEDMNYLAVFTPSPEIYESVLEHIAEETGLIGMIFTDYRDFKQYQRMICEEKNVLVFLGSREDTKNGSQKPAFFHFPKGSLVLDFNEQEVIQKLIRVKRMENEYVNLPIFLDNIIKNGYNSLVNEGLQTEDIQISGLRQNVYRTDEKIS